MKLSSIVPWGRSFEEYRAMFALSPDDLRGRLLGCGDGPASFNAEASLAGSDVVSVDPIYAFSATEIEKRVRETFETIVSQAREQAERFVWDRFADVDALGAARMDAMRCFLSDYESGKEAGRYIEGSFPNLPFQDDSFGLGLCSHLLFLYSTHLSLDEHVAAVRELIRVTHEVRIFPLTTLSGEQSPYLGPVCDALRSDGHIVEIQGVPYEFQRGANRMLKVTKSSIETGQNKIRR